MGAGGLTHDVQPRRTDGEMAATVRRGARPDPSVRRRRSLRADRSPARYPAARCRHDGIRADGPLDTVQSGGTRARADPLAPPFREAGRAEREPRRLARALPYAERERARRADARDAS